MLETTAIIRDSLINFPRLEIIPTTVVVSPWKG